MAKKFRGTDRFMLKKALQVTKAMIAREEFSVLLVGGALKPTKKLSTRALLFADSAPFTGPGDAPVISATGTLATLKAALEAQLAAVV